MIFTKFELENFKSFLTRQSVPMAPITLLYGPNGGGKSSIIQALLMLRQSMGSGTPDLLVAGSDVDLGSWSSIVSQHDVNREVRFALTPLVSYFGHEGELECEPVAFELAYRFEKARRSARLNELSIDWCRDKQDRLSIVHVNANAADAESCEDRRFRLAAAMGEAFRVADPETLILLLERTIRSFASETPRSAFADEIREYLNRHYFVTDLCGLPLLIRDPIGHAWHRDSPERDAKHVLEMMGEQSTLPSFVQAIGASLNLLARTIEGGVRKIKHVGPLRAQPQRVYRYLPDYARSAEFEQDSPWMDALYDDSSLVARCNEWLPKMGMNYRVEIQDLTSSTSGELYQILVEDLVTRSRVTLADVGFGVSQILPILATALGANIGVPQLLCVQQPELHLHPMMQGHVADLVVATVCADRPSLFRLDPNGPEEVTQTQWLIETHSEALITRLQRRIREGVLPASSVSILYVERIEGRGSVVTPLRLDESGDFIDEWPGGFFEDGFDDIFGGL